MSRIELTVFDLDGTLVHLEYDFFHSQVERLFPQLGAAAPSSEELYNQVRNHTLFHCFDEQVRVDAFNYFWENFAYQHRPPPRLIAGAMDTIRQLVENGHEVAIATARSEAVEIVRAYLEPAEINHHVSVISTFVGQSWKDKTQQLLNVCQELRIKPAAALMAGDAPGDIVSARNAGFALGLAVLTGESAEHILTAVNPHRIIDDVSTVPQIIEQFQASPDHFRKIW